MKPEKFFQRKFARIYQVVSRLLTYLLNCTNFQRTIFALGVFGGIAPADIAVGKVEQVFVLCEVSRNAFRLAHNLQTPPVFHFNANYLLNI
jgi:hypothetical protein